MLNSLTLQLRQTFSLSEQAVTAAVASLVDERVDVQEKAAFLTALAQKGETVEEIGAFARALLQHAVQPAIDPAVRQREIMDVCGTGGDRQGTFNISTAVALILASAGIPVAKHGNRAITSQSGSADVLETLGVPIDLSPQEAAESLRDHHFAFFFAPSFHPCFKHIAPARKLCAAQGQRTIFNVLGPLLNPARPSAQLIGVSSGQLCEPIGRVLQSLGVRRGMVVSGRVGESWLDELSVLGPNTVAEFYQDRAFMVGPVSFTGMRFQSAAMDDFAGGDRHRNALILQSILNGTERGPKRDVVLLNAAAALFVAGVVKTLLDGWDFAADLLDSGRADAKLQELARRR
ncbi:MAG: anthranilate phosphoribosyltransferase [Verrucomicrobiota bacterium]